MFASLVFAVLFTSSLAAPVLQHSYSYSRSVGGGSGDSFSTEADGRITGIRVWELPSSYIAGIQLRYDSVWVPVVGRAYGTVNELELFDGEVIIQISGKYHSNYVYQVKFGTSIGRSLEAGQPTQYSFNMYSNRKDGELTMLSGRTNRVGITSLAAHWAVLQLSNSTALSTY